MINQYEDYINDPCEMEILNIFLDHGMDNVFHNIIPSLKVDTIGVKKTKNNFYLLVYNPSFIQEAINNNALFDVILHEYLHVVLNHHERIEKAVEKFRNKELFYFANIAADLAVNFFIDDIANKKQKNEFYKKRFITVEDYPDWFLGPGLSFEEYFMDIKSWMLDLIKTNSQIAQIKCSDGTASVSLYDDEEKIEQFIICPTNNQLLPNAGITSEIEFLSPQLKEQSSPIEMATTIPESLVQKIPNYKKIVEEAARISMPKISNVCTKINNYLQKHMFQNNISTNKKSYSYSKINKKNPLLPGKKQKKEYQFQIYVIVDCSESMETSTRIWEQICEINKIFNITIVPFNSEVLVSKIQSFKQFTFTKERITFKAQGGTKIHAALNYCKDKYGLNNIFIIVSDLDFQGKINDFAKKENFIYLTDIVEGEIQYQKNEVISLCEIPNENIVWV